MSYVTRMKLPTDGRRLLSRSTDTPFDHRNFLIQLVGPDDLQATFSNPSTITNAKTLREPPPPDALTTFDLDRIITFFLECWPKAYTRNDIDQIKVSGNKLYLTLKSTKCELRKAQHATNHPYVHLYHQHAVFWCQDEECRRGKPERVTKNYPRRRKLPFDFGGARKDTSFEVPEVSPDDALDVDLAEEIFNKAGVEAFVEYLNHWWGKITGTKDVLFCDRYTQDEIWRYRKRVTVKEAYELLGFEVMNGKGEMRFVTLFGLWSSRRSIRTFKTLTFDPTHDGDADGEYMNLWRGFKQPHVESVDMGLIQPILDHAFQILAAGKEEFHAYQMGWFASIVQRPWKKTDVAILYKGKEGTGKNIFIEFFGKRVLGKDYYIYINNRKHLVSHFNAHLSGKLLTFVDEVTIGADLEASSILKSIITQTEMHLEHKGMDGVIVDHFNNYIFASNDDMPIRIDAANGDRRYAVSQTADDRKGDFAYFAKLDKLCKDPNTAAHFHKYLRDYDLSDFSIPKIPVTAAKIEIGDRYKAPIHRYFDWVMEDNSKHIHCGVNNPKVNYRSLQDEYETNFLRNERDVKPDRARFTKDMNRMWKEAGIKYEPATKDRSKGSCWAINMSEVESSSPSLQV